MTEAFNISRLGNVGLALELAQRSLNGETITAEDIPEGMHEDILQMAMQSTGAQNLDQFLENPKIVEMIKTGLREDTFGDKAPEDTIIAGFVLGLDDQQLRDIVKSNPGMLNAVVENMPEEQLQELIKAQVEVKMESATVGELLAQTGADQAVINTLPASFTAEKLTELDAGDILGQEIGTGRGTRVESAFTNEQLTTLVALLPNESFEELVVSKMNARLDEGQKLSLEDGAGFEERLALFNEGIARIDADVSSGFWGGLKGFLNNSTGGTEGRVFDEIRAALPVAVETLKAQVTDVDEVSSRITQFDFSNIDIDSTFPPGALKQLVDENQDAVVAAVTSEENYEMIEAMINADLLKKNKERFMDELIPKITETGLNAFNEKMSGLSPQLQQVFSQALSFISKIFAPLQKMMAPFMNMLGGGAPAASNGQDPNQTAPAAPAEGQAPETEQAPTPDLVADAANTTSAPTPPVQRQRI